MIRFAEINFFIKKTLTLNNFKAVIGLVKILRLTKLT